MRRSIVYMIIAFSAIWIVLIENLTLWTVLSGLIVSVICVVLCRKFFPSDKIAGVNYFRFVLYVFYLIGQIYRAGLQAIKLILKGARSDIVTFETEITNDFLRVMLANSITLVPGSVTLDMHGEKLTVMMLRDKNATEQDLEKDSEKMKGRLEKRLLKAQKQK